MAPDGRSFVTAVSLQNASLWVHDANGERQISLEGNAADPKFTPDGKKLLYRIVKEPPSEFAFYRDLGEVRVADLESGRSEPLVRGLEALNYDISRGWPAGRDGDCGSRRQTATMASAAGPELASAADSECGRADRPGLVLAAKSCSATWKGTMHLLTAFVRMVQD